LHAFIEKQEIINTQHAQTMTDLKDILAFAVVRLLKNPFSNLVRKKMS